MRFTASMIGMSPWRCINSRVGTVVDRLHPGHWAPMRHSGQSEVVRAVKCNGVHRLQNA
jgi:hypothetical protein